MPTRTRWEKCRNCGLHKRAHDKKIKSGDNVAHPFNPPGGYRYHPKQNEGK